MSVVEVHLPNGWCTSVRISESTTVLNLLDVVAKKFCGRGVDGSDSKHLSACFLLNGKTQWLQKSDLISKFIPDESPSSDSSTRLKLDVHVRFFPPNLSELSQQVLRLLFEQVFKVYISLNERITGDPTSQPDAMLLLELGCLQMRRVLGDCPAEAVYSKANMRYLEKQVGFSQFFPQILLARYSPAKLSFRRLIRNHLRQFASLSADECTLRFLELLNKNYVFTDETFGHLTLGSSTTDGPDQSIQRIITLRIGAAIGLACVRSTGSICELAAFAQLDSAEIILPASDKLDSRPLLRVKTLDSDSLTLSCRDTSQASAIVSLLDGYTRLFCNGKSLLPAPSKPENNKSEQASASSGVSSNTGPEEDEVTFEVVPFKIPQPKGTATRQLDTNNGHKDAVTSGFATVRKHPKNNSAAKAATTGIGNSANTTLSSEPSIPALPPRPLSLKATKFTRLDNGISKALLEHSQVYLNLLVPDVSHNFRTGVPQHGLSGEDSDYWSLNQVNSANYYASSHFSAFNYDDLVESYDLLPPLPKPVRLQRHTSNFRFPPKRPFWNLGRSRSNSDLRSLPRPATVKSNAQTQTVSQNTQTENNHFENSNETGSNTNEADDALTRSRNAATAAWLARDRTPDSTPPQLSFTVVESSMNSRQIDQSALPYATIRRQPSPVVTNSTMTTTSGVNTGTLNRSNAVGWKHASPVDDYIELFEPDVEIDRNHLEIGVLIGEGQFGDVFEGEYRPNGKEGSCILVAVKMCKSGSDEALGDFLEEACLFRQLAHPYIIALIGVSTSTDPLLILTELAPLGPLRDFLSKERDRLHLSLVDLLTFSAQTTSALAYLHSRRLVHRDIAARNVLVFSRELGKLADFGLARRLPPDAETYTATGGRLPVKWLAPESVNFRKFSRATDVWMLGVFLWEVATFGSRPWQNVRNVDYPMLLAVGARLPRPEPLGTGLGTVVTCPPSLYGLMLSCWAEQPSERPGCDQIFSHLLAVREEALASQRSTLHLTQPPPKPPISEPQQAPKSSSTSLALEQATLWLLDSVATLAPSPGNLGSPLASGSPSNNSSEGKGRSMMDPMQIQPRLLDSRPPLSTLIGPGSHHVPVRISQPNSNEMSKYQEGKQYVVPIIAVQNGNGHTNRRNGRFSPIPPAAAFNVIESLPSPVEISEGQHLYEQTLTVVRCVFTLNKELERVGSDSPPMLTRILDLASAVCTAGRNLLTLASKLSIATSPKKSMADQASLPLLRANLGAHIRSVLAAIKPLSSLPSAQHMLPPPIQTCRQLAEAAAGVAVASRLLLARSVVDSSLMPVGLNSTNFHQSNSDLPPLGNNKQISSQS